MSTKTRRSEALSKRQYEALSEFRYQLRRFLRFSEMICRKQGVTPLQYQVMLHVRGFPGRDWVTVGELAERLQAQPHGALAAILRCEANGMVYRTRSTADRRQIEIRLRPKGERCLKKLAALHHAELKSIRKTIQIARLTAAVQKENRVRRLKL